MRRLSRTNANVRMCECVDVRMCECMSNTLWNSWSLADFSSEHIRTFADPHIRTSANPGRFAFVENLSTLRNSLATKLSLTFFISLYDEKIVISGCYCVGFDCLQ